MNTTSHAPPSSHHGGPLFAGLLLTLAAMLAPEAAVAAAKLKVKAAWSDKTGTLVIKGGAKNVSGPVDIYDINGRLLGGSEGGSFALTLNRQYLANIPCAVRVQADGIEAIKPVKGAPKACAGIPTCSITSPAEGAALQAGVETHFEASASSTDPAAQPLKYEWDFAGGSMGEAIPGTTPPAFKRPTGSSAAIQFGRDNSRYRVRFIVTDAKRRRCEDSLEVSVGTPPDVGLAKVPEQAVPKLGGELDGQADDLVVLPVEEWTMQHASDMRVIPTGYVSFDPLVNNLTALVYRKARLPSVVDDGEVEVRYSATSNPSDPAGAGSINSTSQNWPLNADITQPAPLMASKVQKTDL